MNTEDLKDTGKNKLEAYGKEGLAPLMELFNRYGDEIVHYMRHVGQGLDKGSATLKQNEANEDPKDCDKRKMVASWFEEGAKWVEQLEHQLKNKSSDEILEFVETEGRKHPAALFATSLLAGSVFGAVGKQAYKTRKTEKAENPNIQQTRNQEYKQI